MVHGLKCVYRRPSMVRVNGCDPVFFISFIFTLRKTNETIR